ncbi:hypothetical protein BDV12DRAFT_210776 [Aspergillus spectabilis]
MNVIIAGGGIGGLAAAIGLRRSGHRVKIFERSSFLREVGAAIHVCPNASRILLQWGFDPELARAVTTRKSIVASSRTLKPLVEVDCSQFTNVYGAPWFLVHQVDLHTELKRLATTEKGVGLPVDIVLNSKVIIGHATPAVSTGSAAFRFLIPTDSLRDDSKVSPHVEDNVFKILAAEGHRRMVWYPCANNIIQNFVGIHAYHPEDDSQKEDWDRNAEVDDLLTEYHDFHPDIIAILKKAASVKRWPLLYRDPIPTWTRGRLVLIGDAAHPMLPHQGQGGAQAIEDAGALYRAFTDIPLNLTQDEISRRLAVFENIRVNRASAMQIFSNAGQEEPWKIRELAKPYMPEDVDVPGSPAEFMKHNFGYDVFKDERGRL